MSARLIVIGFDPALGGRGALSLRAHQALVDAEAVFVDHVIADAAALLAEERAKGASWKVLGAESAKVDGVPAEVEQAASGRRVVWLMASDPLAHSWQEALARFGAAAVGLEVLPALGARPLATPRPLAGVRVLVTRARHQAGETCRLLEQRGAEPVCMPTIEIIEDPAAAAQLEEALDRQASARVFDLLLLTSANGVPPLAAALARRALDARIFAGVTVCAIGPGTARALEREVGLRADLVPSDHRAEGVLEALAGSGRALAGARVLLPRAAVARELLPRELEARGAQVELIPVYRTATPAAARTRAGLAALDRGAVDVLSFTSASTTNNFAAVLGAEGLAALVNGRRSPGPSRPLVVAIGPVTAEACAAHGLPVDVMPERYTLTAMVDALEEQLKQSPGAIAAAHEPPRSQET